MDSGISSHPSIGGGLARLLIFALAGEGVGTVMALLMVQADFGFAAALACVPVCGGLGLLLAALANALPQHRTGPAAPPLSSAPNRNGM